MSDPVAALTKRPLIEVHISEPLIPSHSLAQIHRCYHHSPDDVCQKPPPAVMLSNWFKNVDNLYIALHDFVPMEDGDLKLVRGDIVELVDSSSDWWIVRRCSLEEGVVPSNYLGHVFIRSWFYGKITRAESESILKARLEVEENFLVRESETRNNYLTLSVRFVDVPSQSFNLTTSFEDSQTTSTEATIDEQNEVNQSFINEASGHSDVVGCDVEEQKPEENSTWSTITVKHYLIHCTVNGIYYIHPEVSFNTLDDLVSFYSKQKHCLCCKLQLSPTPDVCQR